MDRLTNLRFSYLILVFLFIVSACNFDEKKLNPRDPILFSQNFISEAKAGKETSHFIDTLSTIDPQFLATRLKTDAEKKAFWINCYNGFVLNQLKTDSSLFKNHSEFFNRSIISIGNEKISLNDIENGILRLQSAQKKTKFLKKYQPQSLDYRIHFALNCGAKSCPPISFYQPDDLNEQLEMAETAYISSTSRYFPEKNEVEISILFQWFLSDFGGENGILELLKKQEIIPLWSQAKLTYLPFDWSIYMNLNTK
jgi:hypothetical protein